MRIEAEQLVLDFPSPSPTPRVGYRTVSCTQPGKTTIVFLCERPWASGRSGPSIYTVAERLRERLRHIAGLPDDAIFYSVDRNFPASLEQQATDGALLMPVQFNADGWGSWGSVVTFAKVAKKHALDVEVLKQACLVFP